MDNLRRIHRTIYIILLILTLTDRLQCAILATDLTASESLPKPTLYRQARDDRYYLNRYGSSNSNSHSGHGSNSARNLKDDRPEARNTQGSVESATTNVLEKRCSRCTGYNDYPYDPHRPQERAYDDRYDRYYDERNDRYNDRSYDRYDMNRYDNRYDRDRYDRDRWYDRRYDDRYDRYYDRYDTRGGYDRGGYDANRGGYDTTRGGYDTTRGGMYDYYRGTGYDNRGYDYRKYDMKYRPYDEASRDTGRGGYYAGRPETGAGYDRGYASGYNYGGRGDGYRDNWYTGGGTSGSGAGYRPRDPYSYDGYRSTSYLYDRGSMTPATTRPPSTTRTDHHTTERPGMDSTHSGGSSSSTSG